jgi:hypothetical protein
MTLVGGPEGAPAQPAAINATMKITVRIWQIP